MRQTAKDPKAYATWMVEAWGEDKARILVLEEIQKRKSGTVISRWWLSVNGALPKPPAPPPPPPETPEVRAERWVKSLGVTYGIIDGVIHIPVLQRRFE